MDNLYILQCLYLPRRVYSDTFARFIKANKTISHSLLTNGVIEYLSTFLYNFMDELSNSKACFGVVVIKMYMYLNIGNLTMTVDFRGTLSCTKEMHVL